MSDTETCEGCGDEIDFREVEAFAKTYNDERFWHDECAPEKVVTQRRNQ